jgi:hypothetical protein
LKFKNRGAAKAFSLQKKGGRCEEIFYRGSGNRGTAASVPAWAQFYAGARRGGVGVQVGPVGAGMVIGVTVIMPTARLGAA